MQLSKVTIAALSISTLVIIGAISVVGYVYLGKTPDSSNTQNSSQDEDPSIKILKKYLDFPEENPTLTTITDPEKLKDEAFFKNALKGDQLFFFPKSSKSAYLLFFALADSVLNANRKKSFIPNIFKYSR